MRKLMDIEAAYHSKFGGLWTDRDDWREQLEKQGLEPEDKARLESFVSDGYIILEQAADRDQIQAFRDQINHAFERGNGDVLYQNHGDHTVHRLTEPVDPTGARVVDSYVPLIEALDLFNSPDLVRFLRILFQTRPLLFQSLSFDKGSQQGLHQDTAYVVVDEPLNLAACWIALEDVRAGSGELMYAVGSHRLPDWDFGAGRKHWNAETDGFETHDAWGRHLAEFGERNGVKRFLAKEGDILIWHADLAHGGSPIANPSLSRRSLVGHFCPAQNKPYYFTTHPDRARVKKYRDIFYSSQYYEL
jgi:ectoine hydroxylase-related dioxygenase (phytanoyl-CoA dioxygenase family)